jgi:hypothetical protein
VKSVSGGWAGDGAAVVVARGARLACEAVVSKAKLCGSPLCIRALYRDLDFR